MFAVAILGPPHWGMVAVQKNAGKCIMLFPASRNILIFAPTLGPRRKVQPTFSMNFLASLSVLMHSIFAPRERSFPSKSSYPRLM